MNTSRMPVRGLLSGKSVPGRPKPRVSFRDKARVLQKFVKRIPPLTYEVGPYSFRTEEGVAEYKFQLRRYLANSQSRSEAEILAARAAHRNLAQRRVARKMRQDDRIRKLKSTGRHPQ